MAENDKRGLRMKDRPAPAFGEDRAAERQAGRPAFGEGPAAEIPAEMQAERQAAAPETQYWVGMLPGERRSGEWSANGTEAAAFGGAAVPPAGDANFLREGAGKARFSPDNGAFFRENGAYGEEGLRVQDYYMSLARGQNGGKMPTEKLAEALSTLQKYKAGKENLEKRIINNEKWFRLQHWENMRNDTKRRQTAWLFASIVNKHADFMDNKPEVNVLAREPDDEKTAEALTAVLPVVLERGGWHDAYDEASWDKLKFGGGIYYVTWDPAAYKGLGDISITTADALNVFWEPGIDDIQKSRNVFITKLVANETLKEAFPQLPELEHLGNASLDVQRYMYDENINLDGYSYVVDWYYKTNRNGRTQLHYCSFVDDICLFSSEFSGGYENGWYDHGLYPLIFDPMYPDKGTPYGFGVIDTMRDTQSEIDELNELFMKNVKQSARRRYLTRMDGGVNEQEYADFNKDFVHTSTSLDEQHIKEITVDPLPASYQDILNNKVNELKENSFNRDVNAGGVSGTSTASGIAALQESGSKSSRDIISRSYRVFKSLCEMCIELMRQFYDVPRYFRIKGEDRTEEYRQFDNSGMKAKPLPESFGVDFGEKEPVFDLDVRVSKQNVWSRTAQNQDVLNFYNMGFFAPENATSTLAALEVLELDNKDKLTDVVRRNSIQLQFLQQILPLLIRAAGAVDPQLAATAVQAAAAAGIQLPEMQPTVPAAVPDGGAPQKMAQTDAGGEVQAENRFMEKQRQIANDRTVPR